MPRFLDHARHWYRVYVWGLSYFGDLLLLVVRLYWGSMLVRSGWNRLANLDDTADFLKGLGIFWPKINALLSSSVELGCGALLVIGLAARIATVPLIFNMLVAFATNSGDRFRAIFSGPNDFVMAPEFLYLFACLLILAFGPGIVSLDALIGWFLGRLAAEGAAARNALRSNEIVVLNRGRRSLRNWSRRRSQDSLPGSYFAVAPARRRKRRNWLSHRKRPARAWKALQPAEPRISRPRPPAQTSIYSWLAIRTSAAD